MNVGKGLAPFLGAFRGRYLGEDVSRRGAGLSPPVSLGHLPRAVCLRRSETIKYLPLKASLGKGLVLFYERDVLQCKSRASQLIVSIMEHIPEYILVGM